MFLHLQMLRNRRYDLQQHIMSDQVQTGRVSAASILMVRQLDLGTGVGQFPSWWEKGFSCLLVVVAQQSLSKKLKPATFSLGL